MSRRPPKVEELVSVLADMETSVSEMREWCTVASLASLSLSDREERAALRTLAGQMERSAESIASGWETAMKLAGYQ